MHAKYYSENLKERDKLRDLSLDARVELKLMKYLCGSG
jgi:hypothetical protein